MNIDTTPDPRAALLAALPVGLMGFSAGASLIMANPAMLALLRADPGALPEGTPLRDVLRLMAYRGALGPGDPAQRLEEILTLDFAVPQQRMIRDVEGRGLELRIIPLPDGGHALTLTEFSEYLQARDAAERDARAIAGVLARLNTGVAHYDGQRRLTRNNPAYAQLIGLEPHALQPGLSVAEVVARQRDAGELSAATATAIIEDMTQRSLTQGWRHERTRPGGRTLRFENQPMPDGGWLAEIMDVTETHLAEQDVRRRVALQDALMDALPVGVAVYGPDRVLTRMNPAYNRILSQSPVVVGEHLRDILLRRAHAGEFGCPAANIRCALDDLGVERLDHAYTALDEPTLCREIADRGIIVTVVPTNSYYLRTLPRDRWAAEHPIRHMPAAGLAIHPNTDDPPMHHVDPAGCWRMMHEAFGFGADALRGFMLNGIAGAFVDDGTKAAWRAAFTAEFDALLEATP